MKRIFSINRNFLSFIIAFFIISLLSGCSKNNVYNLYGSNDSIVIIFTNDTHCAIENDIGFAGVSAYKKELQNKFKYVTLVDCGDAIQGAAIGSYTEGVAITKIMNAVSYDICAIGNHEFDYGVEKLANVIENSEAKYICSNLKYTGSEENKLSSIKPYEIVTYGSTKVAYISVVTPRLIASSTPKYFMENDEYVYSFCNDGTGDELATTIQNYVDEVHDYGADYVILLSHLGTAEEEQPYSSYEIATKISGVDVILDAHSHVEMPSTILSDKNDKNVILASTGTELNNIGQIVITSDGFVSVGIITDYDKKDEIVLSVIDEEKQKLDSVLNEKVGETSFDLPLYDENGIRTIRSMETALGDLVADAIRVTAEAEIAIINGGTIRSGISAGEFTFNDIINVSPFLENCLCMVQMDGQSLLDLLEFFYKEVAVEYVRDGKACCESGFFMQISGLKVVLDTQVTSTFELDDNGNLISVSGDRRIKEAYVLKDGEYVPLDPNETYKVASTNYMLINGGGGTLSFCEKFNVLLNSASPTCVVLKNYIQTLSEEDFDQYRQSAGRITIE